MLHVIFSNRFKQQNQEMNGMEGSKMRQRVVTTRFNTSKLHHCTVTTFVPQGGEGIKESRIQGKTM